MLLPMKFFRSVLLALPLLALDSLVAQSTTLNLSTDLVTLGVAATNLTPNTPTLDAGPLLESGMRYATSHQMSRVIANTGAYYFLNPSATSSGAHAAFAGSSTVPMTLDLQGSDLYMAKPGLIGLFVTGGTSLTVQNFTIDYLQQGYTQVLVTGVNAAQRQIQFSVQPGWQNPSAINALIPAGSTETYVYVFRNGQPWSGFVRMPAQAPYGDSAVTLTSATSTNIIAGIRPGDVALIEARLGGNAILASGLTSSALRNIKIYAGGSGVRFLRCTSSLLEHIEVMPRPGTDRLMSTCADGIQPQQLGVNNTIRLCRSIRTGDDGISPVTWVYGSVQSVTGVRTVQVQGDAATALNSGFPLPNGSNVAFERATDGAIVASAVLVSQAAATAIGGLPQMTLTFDRDLPAGVTGTWVYATDASWRSGNLLLERNAIEQQTSFRGISVWGLMNSTLYGNYIHRSSAAGIDVVHQLRVGDWIVPPTVNLTVTNNVVDGTNTAGGENDGITLAGIETRATTNTQSPMSLSTHQNVSIVANFIANPGRSALWISSAAVALVDTNTLFNPNDIPALALGYGTVSTAAQAQQPLVVLTSQNVSLGTNTIDTASGRTWVTDSSYRELAAYAPGATIRLNALNLGAVNAPAISLKDADGKSWPLTVTATSTHAIDVQLPANVGLGGAVVSIKAGAVSYLGTLFVDSQDNIPAINQATFLISPGAATVSSDGGAVSFLVVTQAGGTYAATAADAFVTPGAAGSSTGVVSLTLAKNTGAARTTTIEIAGQPITIAQSGASDPVIAAQPQSQTVANGGTATFASNVTGAQSYQWYLNGSPIAGATAATLTVNGASSGQVGTYTVVAKSATGSVTSSGALLALANFPSVSRLSNLSILTGVTADTPFFTLGTVVGGGSGGGSKALLIRAGGPALAALGLGGTLGDPKLDVFSGQTLVATNDNWGGTATLTAAFAAVGAFGFPSADSKDAAVFNAALPAGGYTVQVSGVGGTTGTVIAEIYDSTPASQVTSLTPRLINVSVLKQINAGDTLTAGFVIAGATSKQVLIRAVGATLGAAPFNLGGVMADPKLDLFSGQTVIATNDNWGTPVGSGAASATQLSTIFGQVGAFALVPGSKDAALLVTLAPGNYTAQVSGVNSTGGQALVEVYEVPSP